MMSRSLPAALACLALWSATPPEAVRAETMHGMAAAKTPADKAFQQSMRTMMTDMAVKTTGNADQDFVAMMLPHHRGAVDMARVELQYGKDPFLLQLAADIVKAQDKEIGAMTDWQSKHPK